MSAAERLTNGLVAYASSPARRRWWFDDLLTGRGAAHGLTAELRSALALVTVARALELVTAEEAETNARAREARRLRQGSDQAVVGVAFALLGLRLVPAAVLVPVLMLVVWLLGGLSDIFDRVAFTASVAEESRIVVIVSALVAGLLLAFTIDLVLGAPKSDERGVYAFFAFWIGIVISGAVYFADATSLVTWYVLPATIVIGYGIVALRTGARAAIRRGERFDFSSLWRR